LVIDKLKETLIKYREAVSPSSPALPLRLPWGLVVSQSVSTPKGLLFDQSFFKHFEHRKREARATSLITRALFVSATQKSCYQFDKQRVYGRPLLPPFCLPPRFSFRGGGGFSPLGWTTTMGRSFGGRLPPPFCGSARAPVASTSPTITAISFRFKSIID
jgi:hypothetical protein